MKVKRFGEFLNENKLGKDPSMFGRRATIIRCDSDIVELTGDDRPDAMKRDTECLDELWNVIDARNSDGFYQGDQAILWYAGSKKGKNGKTIEKFFNNNMIGGENIYNSVESPLISGDKLKFYNEFENEPFLPKTVGSISEARKLKFPIVAKPAGGHSGLGIQKFKTVEELNKSKEKFDLFSEYIDFTNEFRAFFVDNDIIELNERIPVKEDNKTIDTKKVDEKVSFCYVVQDLSKIPYANEIQKIAKVISKKLNLRVFSLDFVLDDNNKVWILETNVQTGMGSGKLAKLYIKLCEDTYKEELPKWYKDYLSDKYIKPGYKMNWSKRKAEIKSSNGAIDYENEIKMK